MRALIISALMIGVLIPALTTAGSQQYFPHALTLREVQPRTGNCISR
ncbi:unnamed protein product [Staurois parvus]|uniref:Uncharacterized protein n=1 Tax=Staurois parvus TaxID=386267 RepID=A0ABN9HBC1_9NEOB|nr:unnamed protein product [Staurois parvus]